MRTPYIPQRILLTGAAGVLGRFLPPALSTFGVPIRLLAHRRPLGPAAAGPDREVRSADLGRPATLRGVADGCDVVVHAAARAGFGRLARARQRHVNVDGTAALLAEAKDAGVRAFVLIGYAGTIQERSDRGVPVDETTPPEGDYEAAYVRMKFEAEARVLEANGVGGMRTLVVSPGVLLHRDARTLLGDLISLFVSGELPFRLLEDVWLATSDAEDVAGCVAAAVARGEGGTRYLATGECLRMGDLYALLAQRTGVAAPRRRLPDLLVEELGMLAPLLPAQSFLRQLMLPRDLVLHLRRLAPVDNRRTREDLALSPRPLLTTLDSILGSVPALAERRVPLGG
jgi:nucleoside-diphosphate-sugar epimerase